MQKLKSYAWLLAPVSVVLSGIAGANIDRLNAPGAVLSYPGTAIVLGLYAAVAGVGVLRWVCRPSTKDAAPIADNQRAYEALADEAHDAMRKGDTATVRNKADAADVLQKMGAKK